MMNNYVKVIWILVCVLWLLAGCASNKNLYYWGHYEPLIYDMYVKPGKADPGTQIEKLTGDIQKAQGRDKTIPPGVYAHLGFMYAIQGNLGRAEEAFNEEKALYPESVVFIDGMMDRAIKINKENQQ